MSHKHDRSQTPNMLLHEEVNKEEISTSTSNPSKMLGNHDIKVVHCPSFLLEAMNTFNSVTLIHTFQLAPVVSPNHAFQHWALFGCLAM